MHRSRLFTLGVALLCVARVGSAQERPISPDPRPDVETVGTGERRIVPDKATVLLIVQSKASTAAAENARAALAVRDTLRQLGLNVSTGTYNVGPDYEPRPVPRE